MRFKLTKTPGHITEHNTDKDTCGSNVDHIQERCCLHCTYWFSAALASPSLRFSLDPDGLDNEEWSGRNQFSQGCKIVERLRSSTAFG